VTIDIGADVIVDASVFFDYGAFHMSIDCPLIGDTFTQNEGSSNFTIKNRARLSYMLALTYPQQQQGFLSITNDNLSLLLNVGGTFKFMNFIPFFSPSTSQVNNIEHSKLLAQIKRIA